MKKSAKTISGKRSFFSVPPALGGPIKQAESLLRPLKASRTVFQDGEHEMYTEEETRIYNQAKDVKNNTACVTCRKTVPMTAEYSIGFGMYQCYECGEKENIFLKKINS